MPNIECLHQCKRCGLVYDCNGKRCGQPFENGYCKACSSPGAMNFIAIPN